MRNSRSLLEMALAFSVLTDTTHEATEAVGDIPSPTYKGRPPRTPKQKKQRAKAKRARRAKK